MVKKPPSVPKVEFKAPVELLKCFTCWLVPASDTLTTVPAWFTFTDKGCTRPLSVNVAAPNVPPVMIGYFETVPFPVIAQRLFD